MSETFTFDVSYSTSFEDLERLREKMLEFVTNERRDYQPVFDVNIKGTYRVPRSSPKCA
jgi:small-conductance mechanosensitive channel